MIELIRLFWNLLNRVPSEIYVAAMLILLVWCYTLILVRMIRKDGGAGE